MPVRNNSRVAVILWPNGDVEVTQVTATYILLLAEQAGARVTLVKVQANIPESVSKLMKGLHA